MSDSNRCTADIASDGLIDCNGSRAVVWLSPLNVGNQPEAVARKLGADDRLWLFAVV
ncbi:hypothetical protein [Delftia tsuruhatensis]|uniref:hypothetical protein n=1 Tax=Delftia tsuruhatensis TaxID=180282 RepID=UPI001F1DDB9B|nr:hypothetical protein [Delftia tsuruhatensis]